MVAVPQFIQIRHFLVMQSGECIMWIKKKRLKASVIYHSISLSYSLIPSFILSRFSSSLFSFLFSLLLSSLFSLLSSLFSLLSSFSSSSSSSSFSSSSPSSSSSFFLSYFLFFFLTYPGLQGGNLETGSSGAPLRRPARADRAPTPPLPVIVLTIIFGLVS